ncbi:hypothetical protein D6851_02660 [Altericroceibacterium spongiae]|uniref:Uncharacterized protein n=1 Tax=Altericroceibacterium spongiae TaxID=2320269 RepID=A0A420ERV1_9SPHN|nr:hypothetical protein [Altericroceibacterium spongiae]RKF23391.1 hypothetical protein D6851_02660 [Altericroceibacterium spongiae]
MTYNEKIAAIISEIAPVLKADFLPELYAAGLLEEADEDDLHFEVRGLHTKTGAPHAFSI